VTECIFCRIVAGAVPAKKVAETDHVLAFRDIHPQAPTHVLLVPKAHVADSIADLGIEHGVLLAEIFMLAGKIARQERLENGWRLVANVGLHAGQSVRHLHMHLLGGRPMKWPPG
jgi:histidine triad (HIT) family protein